MKYTKLFIVALFVFFTNTYVCDAFYGRYNYEVNSFTVNGNTATISGWAIMNARKNPDNGGTGEVIKNMQSGEMVYLGSSSDKSRDNNYISYYGGYCKYGTKAYYVGDSLLPETGKHNNHYTYVYDLEIYKVYSDGREATKVEGVVTKKNAPIISLTYAQAVKCNNIPVFNEIPTDSCHKKNNKKTACYENVGFKFDIDMNKLPFSKDIKGYKMRLTVETGAGNRCTNCSQAFDIIALSNSGNSGFINDVVLTNTTKNVKLLVTGGKGWKEANFNSGKVWGDALPITNYEVLDISYDSISNINWYKIKANRKEVWVPASWVNPVGEATLITVENKKEVETCRDDFVPSAIQKNTLTCDGVVDANIQTDRECTTSITRSQFYSIACNETVDADFNPSNLTNLKIGQGFKFGINITSKRKCTGTFDSAKWSEAYNLARSFRDSYQVGTSGYIEYNNKMKDLLQTVKTYTDWNLNNYVMNPTGTMRVSYRKRGLNTNDTVSFVINDRKDSSTTIKKSREHKLGISGLANPFEFTYDNSSDPSTVSLVLSKSYINLNTGDISYSNCNGCVSGGNKYYLDRNGDVGNYQLNITVSNLGEFGNLTIVNNLCSVKVVENGIIYRTVDVKNPFININRTIGINWLNNNFSFINVIDSNVWDDSKSPLYVFDLRKDNIRAIKKSNDLEGSNAYLGTCHNDVNMDEGTKFICDIIKKDY